MALRVKVSVSAGGGYRIVPPAVSMQFVDFHPTPLCPVPTTADTTGVFVLLVLALLGGVAIGLVRGGTLNALGRIHVSRPQLFVGVLLALVVGRLIPGLHSPGWIVATMLMALFAAANSRLPGLSLLLAGLALNAIVVTANGGRMPVSTDAAVRAGVSVEDVDDSRLLERDPPDPALRAASDVIPLPLPFAPSAVSLGDVFAAAGVGLFGAVAPLRARRTLDARRRARGSGRTRAAASPGRHSGRRSPSRRDSDAPGRGGGHSESVVAGVPRASVGRPRVAAADAAKPDRGGEDATPGHDLDDWA